MRDISERRRIEKRIAAQREVLERIASNTPLDATLETIVQLVEREFPGMLCSVLVLDETRKRLHNAAAPSLPAAWNRAIEGEPIGPQAGSCGTAAWRREPVVVRDISADPLWDGYRDLALAHGLRACWSMPVFSASGEVLGTFAMYYAEAREPLAPEREVVGTAAFLAGIAIERSREHASMRAAVERSELIGKATNDAVWDWDLATNQLWWNEAYYRHFGFPAQERRPGLESWSERVHPEDHDRVVTSLHAVIEGGGDTW
ncbi:MAG TPA: GAF domain-containing protein, partial [Anaeromyxobacteraceae bacterium]|nr:GAF domain-containing protein [Anaeromyxobacteraceae bacterium]